MVDPLRNLNDIQIAALNAWCSAAQQVLQYWSHLFELQQNFLKHAAQHACDTHRFHAEIARGASFTDKYGRRAHDIDPERDV